MGVRACVFMHVFLYIWDLFRLCPLPAGGKKKHGGNRIDPIIFATGASGYRTNSQFSNCDGIPVSAFYPEGQRQALQPVYEGPRYHVLQRQVYPEDREPVRWRRYASSPFPNHTSEVILPVSQETQV